MILGFVALTFTFGSSRRGGMTTRFVRDETTGTFIQGRGFLAFLFCRSCGFHFGTRSTVFDFLLFRGIIHVRKIAVILLTFH